MNDQLIPGVDDPAELLLENRVASRMHAKDATLFDFSDVALQSAQDYMGWTDLASNPPTAIEQIQAFAQEALAEGIDYVGLLGEGGSSQAPMTITKLSAAQHRDVRFSTLDSLSPVYVRQILHGVDYRRSLFIVSSKSGGTIETLSLYKIIWEDVVHELGEEEAARHFVAITDPGSGLEQLARERNFRGVFLGEPSVGGRFSALSVFGLVPAALCGLDVAAIVSRAAEMERLCAQDSPTNPAIQLADFLARNLSRRSAFAFTYPHLAPAGPRLWPLDGAAHRREPGQRRPGRGAPHRDRREPAQPPPAQAPGGRVPHEPRLHL